MVGPTARRDLPEVPVLVVAHLSDPHVDGTARSSDRFRRALSHATSGRSRRADVVVLTGDVAAQGRPDQYAEAARLIAASPVPVLAVPGNHDHRIAFRDGLLGGLPGPGGFTGGGVTGGGAEPLHRVERVAGAAFVLLDSTAPGRDGGALDQASLTWLATQLDALEPDAADGTDGSDGRAGPVFVVLHHPPLSLGTPSLDAIALADPASFLAVLAGRPGVVAVLAGHVHGATVTVVGGKPVLIAPGIASTFRLPWEPAPVGGGTADPDAPPLLAFHVLEDDGRLSTHVRPVPEG